MCLQSSSVDAPGSVPDLAASPLVLTCTWMFRGVDGAGVRVLRPESRALAFLMLSMLETHQRLGILDARGLHLSKGDVSMYWRWMGAYGVAVIEAADLRNPP